ncbi:MAG: type II toxin-antitoxin system HicB family antitoxin [Chloroflexota bacterium]|nr:type II toxin-antitoxin system HicB family antitoxin [Chloroflexota bacterium]
MKYWVVIEKSAENYAAYVPDLPGCVATGNSRDEVELNIREAIEFHLAGLAEDGDPIIAPASWALEIEVAAPPASKITRAG